MIKIDDLNVRIGFVALILVSAGILLWVINDPTNPGVWTIGGFLTGIWYVAYVVISGDTGIRNAMRQAYFAWFTLFSAMLIALWGEIPAVWFFAGFCAAYWIGVLLDRR